MAGPQNSVEPILRDFPAAVFNDDFKSLASGLYFRPGFPASMTAPSVLVLAGSRAMPENSPPEG